MGDHQVRLGLVRETARGALKKHGIKEPPVSPETIAAAEGLEVRMIMTWPESLSGLLLRDSRCIGINAKHAPTRRRFSLAHELGHWLLRHDVAWHERDVTIDEPPQEVPNDELHNWQEAEANEFAGELLAPREMLKVAMKKTKEPSALAGVFQISDQALWVRILRHNLLK